MTSADVGCAEPVYMTTYRHENLQRLQQIMRRHVRDEDRHLSDDALVRVVFARYEDAYRQPLIDPNE